MKKSEMKATPEDAAHVAEDLMSKAKAMPSTRSGGRAAQALYNAAAMVEQVYGIEGHATIEGD
jgi:hypothetical protein